MSGATDKDARARRDAFEGANTAVRIFELELNPVRGNFDAAHLREVNRRIFQDMPGAGYTDVTPGEYRPPVEGSRDWVKNRGLETTRASSHVAYSPMDAAAQKQIEAALKSADPAALSKLKTAEFTEAFGKLYAELDYLHPFTDGNSRTLRTFTKQLAKEAGYDVDWARFNVSPGGRDILYIARDLSVNERALPQIKDQGTMRLVVNSQDTFAGNRPLPDLLKDAIRPTRAVAFERLPEADAMKAHPELAEAYKTVRTAKAFFSVELKGDTEAQHKALATVTRHIQDRLNQGETHDFRADREKEREQSPAPAKAKAAAPRQKPTAERER